MWAGRRPAHILIKPLPKLFFGGAQNWEKIAGGRKGFSAEEPGCQRVGGSTPPLGLWVWLVDWLACLLDAGQILNKD